MPGAQERPSLAARTEGTCRQVRTHTWRPANKQHQRKPQHKSQGAFSPPLEVSPDSRQKLGPFWAVTHAPDSLAWNEWEVAGALS